MSDLTSLLSRLGARFGEGPDPADFGDPAAEARAAESALGAGHLPWEGVVRVGGKEAVPFLQRLLSSDLRELAPGASAPGCLLSPTGRALAVVLAMRTDEEVLLEVEIPFARPLAQALDRYLFAEAVEISDESESAVWLVLLGPSAPDALRSIGVSELPARGNHAASPSLGGKGRLFRPDLLGLPEYRLLAPRDRAASLLDRLLASVPGAKPIGTVALEHLRIRAGLPRPGLDLDDSVYPEEAGLAAALSTSKGCYPGQEVVAKIRTYGGAKRRLVALDFDAGDAPRRGDLLERRGAEVGRLTSVCAEPALGPAHALALVKREAAEPGTLLDVRRGPAGLRARVRTG